MAIEVRQVTIKSVVASGKDEEKNAPDWRQEEERIKDEILSECRQMMHELMRANRER